MAETFQLPINCGANEFVHVLKELKENQKGANAKVYFSSYPKWDSQTTEQQNKTTSFFLKLDDFVKAAVLSKATELTAANKANETERTTAWNKHDYTRMMHLRVEPACSAKWDIVMHPIKQRRVLDSRNSTMAPSLDGGSLADAADAWGSLAETMNDYENFRPQNELIQYHTVGDSHRIGE